MLETITVKRRFGGHYYQGYLLKQDRKNYVIQDLTDGKLNTIPRGFFTRRIA